MLLAIYRQKSPSISFPGWRPDLCLESWGLIWEEGRQCFLTLPQHLGKNHWRDVYLKTNHISSAAEHICPSAWYNFPQLIINCLDMAGLSRGWAAISLRRGTDPVGQTPHLHLAESNLPVVRDSLNVMIGVSSHSKQKVYRLTHYHIFLPPAPPHTPLCMNSDIWGTEVTSSPFYLQTILINRRFRQLYTMLIVTSLHTFLKVNIISLSNSATLFQITQSSAP